jgi:hypothetical protein
MSESGYEKPKRVPDAVDKSLLLKEFDDIGQRMGEAYALRRSHLDEYADKFFDTDPQTDTRSWMTGEKLTAFLGLSKTLKECIAKQHEFDEAHSQLIDLGAPNLQLMNAFKELRGLRERLEHDIVEVQRHELS